MGRSRKNELTVEITSVPDRDDRVAELWWGRDMLAELRHEQDGLYVQLYKAPGNDAWDIPYRDLLAGLERAKSKLGKPGRQSSDDDQTADQGTYVRYLFIWDKNAREVVVSYYIHRPDRPDHVANDVSHGAIPAVQEEDELEALQKQYPSDRYIFGGGWAPSLDASVKGFFGMEKDTDVYG